MKQSQSLFLKMFLSFPPFFPLCGGPITHMLFGFIPCVTDVVYISVWSVYCCTILFIVLLLFPQVPSFFPTVSYLWMAPSSAFVIQTVLLTCSTSVCVLFYIFYFSPIYMFPFKYLSIIVTILTILILASFFDISGIVSTD